ncbi:transmembrane protein 177 [Stomoxys calcitrans]|uniref:transmembrane protein 177 n=1 Tax=Stomoxys calcitrans TaxID=35570 RepID=UPI0027E2D2D7|nr:transmembrane protein 177 [Stomoxys calcitrans]
MRAKYIGAAGSKKAFAAAGATTIGLFLVNYVPNTFGLEYYKNFLQCYKHGQPVTLSKKVLERFEKAKEFCELEQYEVHFAKPFTVFGFDVSLLGTTKSRFGAFIGIPANYEYESVEDIKHNEIRFRDQDIDWNSESGKYLKESLVLTEDEQIFGLCKALLQAKTQYVLMNSIYPSLSFLTVYTVGSYLNSSLGLLARPFSLRLVMYSILGLFGFGSWCFLKDYSQVSLDADIDKNLSDKGSRFVQAGISYYDKQLKKNMALRKLLNDDTFTVKGNVNYFLRQESLPLTIRKSYFESKLEESAN